MVVIVAAQVVAMVKARPACGMAKQVIVAHGQFVQFRPAVRIAFHKAGRLDDLQPTFIIEVSKTDIPGPAVAREAQRFACLTVGRNPGLHETNIAGAQEYEIALFQREL